MKVNRLIILLVACTGLVTIASGQSKQTAKKLNFDTLIYRDNPGSVPASSFRRKTFTVSKKQVKLVIDDKEGKIVEQATAELTPEDFAKIAKAVNSGNFKKEEASRKSALFPAEGVKN